MVIIDEAVVTADNCSNAILDQPFRRPRLGSMSQVQQQVSSQQACNFNIDAVKKSIQITLKSLGEEVLDDTDVEKLIETGLETIANAWKKRDNNSEQAFQGLLEILEYCLQHTYDSQEYFEKFVNELGYNTVQFWRAAVPYIFDSDMASGTKFRDGLLFSLTLYDVNTGRNRLKELYAAVPGIQKSLLGVKAKRFGEQFYNLQRRRSHSQLGSQESLNNSTQNSDDEENEANGASDGQIKRKNSFRTSVTSNLTTNDGEAGSDGEEYYPAIGLANTHFQQRVINVSNAPPVSLKKEKSGEWGIKQGSGGLVTCVDPVMSVNQENIWLANLGMNLQKEKPSEFLSDSEDASIMGPTTNTLGLPLLKQNMAKILFPVLANDYKEVTDSSGETKEEMSLLDVLNNFNKENYKLNPVVVQESDYNFYYGGISNGLLWPALHNLPEYISADYDDTKTLKEHWTAYVRVNYQFAIDAVRNSRPQDFIWIHDYHLMLTGMVMQNLDPNLEIGFFLHIPFLPPDDFFTKYGICAFPILRGLLRFTKIGFQTHRDRSQFIEFVKKYLLKARVSYEQNIDAYAVTFQDWTCSLGVFPVSIKNEDFLEIAKAPETVSKSHEIRKKILGENPPPDARLFFSVERFDYTKGIKEKLYGYRRYLEKYPDRTGKDVLLQIAVTNRSSVDTYKKYQDECIEIAKKINDEFHCPDNPEWKPLIFRTDGLQRADLIAHYLAMDVGVVTPKKDGMNLVAKEMLICNPFAGLILSTGAGTEIQFTTAGLHPDDGDCTYHRLVDLYDVDKYADVFYAAATEPANDIARHGQRLNEFVMANDIERWSAAFLDPGWSHMVIHQREIKTLDDFYSMMMRARDVRRQIVERVLKGIPIQSHFEISLNNAKESLMLSCKQDTTTLYLKPSSDQEDHGGELAHFDIKTELDEFEKDLNFLKFIQNDDVYNVEEFINTLSQYHPLSEEKFHEEVIALGDLLTDADHFNYFFTDRDGTLKSYSSSYPASVQPAYSGVIQAQFARRCAQTCAIVTTAPMMQIGVLDVSTIPEGYYYYGASAGREWFIDPETKFKDTSIPENHLELLDRVFIEIRELLDDSKFKHFTWLGSGLQKHYGHITVAHQDVFHSVPQHQADAIDQKIREIVSQVDPNENVLSVKESEMDIKIFLKSKLSGDIFDKGNGIRLLASHMKCDLKNGTILVCGDSETDLPMLEECLKDNPQGVYTVWVTTNEELRIQVKEICEQYGNKNYLFVSCPEVLLGGMAQATIREISIGHIQRATHLSE